MVAWKSQTRTCEQSISPHSYTSLSQIWVSGPSKASGPTSFLVMGVILNPFFVFPSATHDFYTHIYTMLYFLTLINFLLNAENISLLLLISTFIHLQKKRGRGSMSCSTVLVNNFTTAEDFDLDGEFSIITAKMKSKLQKAIMKESSKSRSRSTDDMSQTICLFKKYLTKAQNNIGKTNMEESQVIKKCHSDEDSSAVPVSECDPRLSRKASLMEQKLLPLCDGVPSSVSEDRSVTGGQLTIFYGGAINVYDNVPVDKAQAIMLLAGEISSSNSAATNEIPEVDTQTSHLSNATPTSKIKTGPSMARRVSLQCFLKKRHNRMVNKSPYAFPIQMQEAELTKKEDQYPYHQNHGISLAPFPSHGGFNFPVS